MEVGLPSLHQTHPPMTLLVFLSGLLGLIITVLWLVIGWRAMRAHERLADGQDAIATELRRISQPPSSAPQRTPLSEIDPKSFPKFSE